MSGSGSNLDRLVAELVSDLVLIPRPAGVPTIRDMVRADREPVHEAGDCWCPRAASCPGEPPARDPWAGVIDAVDRVAVFARSRDEVVRLTPDQVALLRLAQDEPARDPEPIGRTLGRLVGVPIEITTDYDESTPALLRRARETGATMPTSLPPRGAQLMRPAYTGTAPVEAKVKSSAIAAGLAGVALAALSQYVFDGGPVPDAFHGVVTSVAGGVVTAAVTFVAGFLAKHAHRWVRVTDEDAPPAADDPTG